MYKIIPFHLYARLHNYDEYDKDCVTRHRESKFTKCLVLVPTLHKYKAGTPVYFKDGDLTVITYRGAINHYHTIYQDSGCYNVPMGWDPNLGVSFVWARHYGKARKVLRKFAEQFLVDPQVQAHELRKLVREGD